MPKADKDSLINDTKSSYYGCAKCGYHTCHSSLSVCCYFILLITHKSELFCNELFYREVFYNEVFYNDETNKLSSYGLALYVVIVDSVIDVS